ncbi:hypothetical protein BH23BAC2_BH23BAC2_15660 [soil metagenome]
MDNNNQNKNWNAVVLKGGEGEKILFRIGLMTFKTSSSMTNNNFVICETELPPGANVDEHIHSEAETFYILEGQFTFFVDNMKNPINCTKGAFISIPPNVKHAFKNSGSQSGKILGTFFPGGPNGFESLFRTMGIKLNDTDEIPDLNKPVEHLLNAMARMKESKS